MNNISSFDNEKEIKENQKAKAFYHGLVLGMIVQQPEYRTTSSRESDYGRYGIIMMPKDKILEDEAYRALKQIQEKTMMLKE